MSTNYYNTFIEIADDCPAEIAEAPAASGQAQTVASLQFEMLDGHPYQYTSDDVLFQVYAIRNGIAPQEMARARAAFFAKEQPCFRASPLTKRYGWGVHSDETGKIALYAVESDAYRRLAGDGMLKHLKAMRSKRK